MSGKEGMKQAAAGLRNRSGPARVAALELRDVRVEVPATMIMF
jgi:hypothetical protein